MVFLCLRSKDRDEKLKGRWVSGWRGEVPKSFDIGSYGMGVFGNSVNFTLLVLQVSISRSNAFDLRSFRCCRKLPRT